MVNSSPTRWWRRVRTDWIVCTPRPTCTSSARRMLSRCCGSRALRCKSRRVPLEDVEVTRASGLHSGAEATQDSFLVMAAIRALPEAYRETMVMRLVEGMTGPEIADRTGLTPESVRVNLCRGMKMLREKLESK